MIGNVNNIKTKKKNEDRRQSKIDQPLTGFGHIIIPSDIERKAYIKLVFKTGKCLVLDTYGTFLRDVLVPKNQMDQISFPYEDNTFGSLVGWVRVKEMNAYAITNIYFDGKELSDSSENQHIKKKGDSSSNIIISESTKKNPHRVVVVRGNSEEDVQGGHEIHTQGSSGKSTQITQDLEGNVLVSVDRNCKTRALENISLYAEKNIELEALEQLSVRIHQTKENEEDEQEYNVLTIDNQGTLSYTDRFGASITINEDHILIDHEISIQLGKENVEPAILGDKAVKWLSDLVDLIKQITVTTSYGPSGTPINNLLFTELASTLDNLKSELITVE